MIENKFLKWKNDGIFDILLLFLDLYKQNPAFYHWEYEDLFNSIRDLYKNYIVILNDFIMHIISYLYIEESIKYQ